MKKSPITLCLSAGLSTSTPGANLADVNVIPQNTTTAPAIPTATLQQLAWTPVDQSKTQSASLVTAEQRLDIAGISDPVATYSVSADVGELTLTLGSEVNEQTSIFAPNVLILDQDMTPSAPFPSSYFTYQAPGVMDTDRLEGVMRLTPALGQQKLRALVFTTDKDLQQTTTLLDLAKTCAKGVGNAVPGIPDPIACHTADGLLHLKVETSSSSGVLVGPLFGSSGPGPATVGNTTAPAVAYAAPAAAVTAPAPQPMKKSESVLNDTESYFDQAIKGATTRDDVDKALKLLDEAECLGSKSTRSTFISSVKDEG